MSPEEVRRRNDAIFESLSSSANSGRASDALNRWFLHERHYRLMEPTVHVFLGCTILPTPEIFNEVSAQQANDHKLLPFQGTWLSGTINDICEELRTKLRAAVGVSKDQPKPPYAVVVPLGTMPLNIHFVGLLPDLHGKYQTAIGVDPKAGA